MTGKQQTHPLVTIRTLKDLAAALGVSRTTVSNAFNRPDQLSPQLRERILNEAQNLGYPGPDPVARKLRTGRAAAIGVLFGDTLPYAFTDAAAIGFLRGVAQICEQHHVGMLILPVQNEPSAGKMIRDAAVDGFITYCLPDESPVIPYILERRVPTVGVEQNNMKGAVWVSIDDTAGAAAAARHLLELGHRRMAILSLDLKPDRHAGRVSDARRRGVLYQGTAHRLSGYDVAFKAAGIDPATVPVIECPGNERKLARELTMSLLQGEQAPTAILAMSDVLAAGALQAAETLGIPVPERLSIAGFDDIPLATQVRPTLTTVRQPLQEKGQLAARLLLDARLRDKGKREHILETALIVRESTARPFLA